MSQPAYTLPRDELKDFLQSLSRITELSMAFVPAGSYLQDLIIGETSFCLQFKASGEGSLRCKAFNDGLIMKAGRSREPEFDLCHARMAEVAIPIISDDGSDFGTVVIGQAVIEGLSDEHKDHIRELASVIDPDDADLLVAAAEGGGEKVSAVMRGMGMHMAGGEALPPAAIDPYVEIFGEMLRRDPPYTFGDDEDLYSRLFDLGFSNIEYSKDMVFPEDAIFIDRSLGGHFGNLSRLRATGPWREIVYRYADKRGGGY